MKLNELGAIRAQGCPCGKPHVLSTDRILCGAGVLSELPGIVRAYNGKKPYVLADKNTAKAGAGVFELLRKNGIAYDAHVFDDDALEPNETNVGLAFMYRPVDSDVVIGVGSGVINDIGKIVSAVSGKPYIIVATAPSMDGYASASSSMTREGLKISLPSRCPDAIIGDADVLSQAPIRSMRAGLGDMLAKTVSVCEWRISHLVTGEYYCEAIADLMRKALKRCIDSADGLLRRDPDAVIAVFEGLVISGLAMNFAGVSRPASGIEHYFSHVWDMRGAQFGTPVDRHGIQCAVGTLIAIRLYERLKTIVPDREKALRYAAGFDLPAWRDELRSFLGKGAESMIELDRKEKKYDVDAHKQRLNAILANWDGILRILSEELPSSSELEALFDRVGLPKTPGEIGIDESTLPMAFRAAKDIRNKYVLPRLAWDLGVLEELL